MTGSGCPRLSLPICHGPPWERDGRWSPPSGALRRTWTAPVGPHIYGSRAIPLQFDNMPDVGRCTRDGTGKGAIDLTPWIGCSQIGCPVPRKQKGIGQLSGPCPPPFFSGNPSRSDQLMTVVGSISLHSFRRLLGVSGSQLRFASLSRPKASAMTEEYDVSASFTLSRCFLEQPTSSSHDFCKCPVP